MAETKNFRQTKKKEKSCGHVLDDLILLRWQHSPKWATGSMKQSKGWLPFFKETDNDAKIHMDFHETD